MTSLVLPSRAGDPVSSGRVSCRGSCRMGGLGRCRLSPRPVTRPFQNQTFHIDTKHVFWTDNDLGNGLHDALLALVRAQVLDRREEADEQFRWHHSLDRRHRTAKTGRPSRENGCSVTSRRSACPAQDRCPAALSTSSAEMSNSPVRISMHIPEYSLTLSRPCRRSPSSFSSF
jgi:hypothetical protein